MQFSVFGNAVLKRFNEMQQHGLFRARVEKNMLWDLYLDSFPEGSNPIYVKRTEHDCDCCKGFVRSLGGIVSIIDGKIATIWDISIGEGEPYQSVADKMAEFVRICPIDNIFLNTESVIGKEKTLNLIGDNPVNIWNHFHARLEPKYVLNGLKIGPKVSMIQSGKDVFLRGLKELDIDAFETVLDLAAQNSIYKGQENVGILTSFLKMKKEFESLPDDNAKDLFAWIHASKEDNGAVTRFRSSAIGTLIIDLSGIKDDNGEWLIEPRDLQPAVKSFEAKVAPANYKRPTAVVSKKQIEEARNKIEELGFADSLERRFANINDININDILFANRDAKKAMNVFDKLSDSIAEKKQNFDKVEEVSIDNFFSIILPKSTSLEILFENRHAGNLVSLIAPVHSESKIMFKWPNNFSWSYRGGVSDSMREQVAKLGGRIDGCLRFTHSWNHSEVGRNGSLMDLHVFMPGCKEHEDGCHDKYPDRLHRVGWNQRNHSKTGGSQDVDYTAVASEGYIPIENISFPDIRKMPEGKYVFKIHNWDLRQPTKSGFKAEIEFGGQIFQFEHPAPLKHKEWVTVATATLKDSVFTMDTSMPTTKSSREIWNIPSETFRKVTVAMLSPNYWGEHGTGNKHFFFMLSGCLSDEPARPFLNEFLVQELDAHRKVFEMVGAKMLTENSDKQLSGLGFSSTLRSSFLCRVEGSFSRVVKVVI